MGSIFCARRRRSASSPKPPAIRCSRPTRLWPICAPGGLKAPRCWCPEAHSLPCNAHHQLALTEPGAHPTPGTIVLSARHEGSSHVGGVVPTVRCVDIANDLTALVREDARNE